MMERKDKKIRFRKLGGGSLRLSGRIIKPNQVFTAYPEEIPQGFRDVVKPVDKNEIFPEGRTEEEEIAQIESVEPVYYKKHRGGGWYDIYRKDTGKKMNESSVRTEEADNLLEQLNLEEQ